VHQSPALAEIEAGPHNTVVISEWVTQDRMIVQDLGFEEAAFQRFGVDLKLRVAQVKGKGSISSGALEARHFISDAFLQDGEENYALTAAIAEVFTQSDAIAGIRYPSLALNGRADNFALRPDYVQHHMRLESATFFQITGCPEAGVYDFNPIADLTSIDETGSLSWTYRDHQISVPPGASLAIRLPVGAKRSLQVAGSTDLVIENLRYSVVPGTTLEMLADGPTLRLPDGSVLQGTEVTDAALPVAVGGAVAKDSKMLAYEANSRLSEFQTIMAIAVRSQTIAGKRVSVASAIFLNKLDVSRNPWTCQSKMQPAFEFHEPRAAPEYVAWWTLLSAMQKTPLPTPALLIVEAGVETLAAINARKQAVIGKELLPPEFTLAWGRSTGDPTDFVSSKVLGECANDATSLLNWLSGHPESLAKAFQGAEHYSRMRVWPRELLPKS
jgi:hypothetical protein